MKTGMPTPTEASVQSFAKAPTGIVGFDEITNGGLPRGRSTLLEGGPGSGKTIFALQFLVHGARVCKEPGIFVAFEESAERIFANAASFDWKLASLKDKSLYMLDAQPSPDLIQSGNFDLGGLLAMLSALVARTRATRIVFDALDILLALLPDEASKRREVYRLHQWLLDHGLTAVITAKAGGDDASSISGQEIGFMQFMVDCVVILSHGVSFGVSQRNLRVQKYRGSAFDEHESPFLIGHGGFEVAGARTVGRNYANTTHERVSSGVERLDTMLGGGYYRGASVLITGFPGTAKTTLSGAFAEAACARGERTLFVSFDSDFEEVIRNLSSVNIRLARFAKSGLLRVVSVRAISGNAENYLLRIKAYAVEHAARCIVVDPISTLSSSPNELTAHSVAERLIDWSKSQGITLLCTSLIDESSTRALPASPLQLSTLADTWIHLNYLAQAGERNRGLSIIKSRGTAHSNQVRELILSDAGVTLADTYTAGGEVLMGTMRWQKENAESAVRQAAEVATRLKGLRLDAEEAELQVRARSLQVELEAKQAERALLDQSTETRQREQVKDHSHVKELRGADVKKPVTRRSRS
ncbi:MAG: circadian clock protein KaiC [Dokdonella sp.]|uniref:circadian clock protein KaiC n=1 Tax=Dokdonella sp. TaxID=2291710 RepID=UPI003266D9FA